MTVLPRPIAPASAASLPDAGDGRISSGIVTITVKNGLLSRATQGSGLDRMDPYIEVRPSWNRSSVYKTLPHENGHKKPEWMPIKHHTIFKIKFPGGGVDQRMIVGLRCLDKNRFTKDQVIGEGSFNIMPILRARSAEPIKHSIKLFYDKTMNNQDSPKGASSSSSSGSFFGGRKDNAVDNATSKSTTTTTTITTTGDGNRNDIENTTLDTDTPDSLVRTGSGTLQRSLSGNNFLHKGTVAGRIWIEVHFQPETFSHVRTGSGRGGLGALIGVVAEKIHDNQIDPVLGRGAGIVMPNSAFRRRWDMVTLLGLVYTAIFTPVQITFLGDIMTTRNISDWWFVFLIDRLIDVVFLTDIVVNFRSAWEAEDGMYRFDAKEGAWKYMTGWFLLDLVSALPMDFLELLITENAGGGDGGGAGAASNLRSLKLIRLFRLVKIAKVVRASRLFKRFEAEMNIKYAMLRLIKFLGVILIVAHWNSCGFYLVSTLSEGTAFSSWAEASGLEWGMGNTPGDKYVASLYWAMMTLTTIGYGDIVATNVYERIYVIFSMMLCTLVVSPQLIAIFPLQFCIKSESWRIQCADKLHNLSEQRVTARTNMTEGIQFETSCATKGNCINAGCQASIGCIACHRGHSLTSAMLGQTTT